MSQLPAPRPSSGPDQIGPYRIEHPLDAGGMGSVYVARHTLTEARVALKVLHGTADKLTTTRFLREVRAASRIGHPGVVQVLDAGQTDAGQLFLVMELLEGETLWARMDSSAPRGVLLRLLLASLPALAAAHRAGIVHRDLKPENLFVLAGEDEPCVKLLDFGIALELDPDLTQTGNVLGTPHYMSPEQARAPSQVGPASDVWAVGVMLYELLSGELPFDGETAGGVVVALCTEAPVPLSERSPELSPELVAVVERCLQKEPGPRYADAAELMEALRPWMDGASIERELPGVPVEYGEASLAPPALSALPVRSRWPALALLAGLAAATGLAGVWAHGGARAPELVRLEPTLVVTELVEPASPHAVVPAVLPDGVTGGEPPRRAGPEVRARRARRGARSASARGAVAATGPVTAADAVTVTEFEAVPELEATTVTTPEPGTVTRPAPVTVTAAEPEGATVTASPAARRAAPSARPRVTGPARRASPRKRVPRPRARPADAPEFFSF